MAQTVFTVRGPEYPADKRGEYDYAVMDLALRKTVSEYGPYELRKTPPGENFKRALQNAKNGVYKNFFIRALATRGLGEVMQVVPFPVERGILGYRVAFIAGAKQKELSEVTRFSDLTKYSVVQGIGWIDSKILNENGFTIRTGPSFNSMFSMITEDRADLFLRGVNEVLNEWNSYSHQQGLSIEKTFAIHYPFPRFFHTAKGNSEAADRVYKGLKAAYEDGSFLKIWKQYFEKSIRFAKLSERRIFSIPNPLISVQDKTYEKYNFHPDEMLSDVYVTE